MPLCHCRPQSRPDLGRGVVAAPAHTPAGVVGFPEGQQGMAQFSTVRERPSPNPRGVRGESFLPETSEDLTPTALPAADAGRVHGRWAIIHSRQIQMRSKDGSLDPPQPYGTEEAVAVKQND